jgi:hypothetical protein
LAGVVVIFLILLTRIIPEIKEVVNIQNETKTQSSALADAERKLEDLKKSEEAKKERDANVIKAFFKPINTGLDTEGAISDEFEEIAQIMRNNKIKARSIKYDYDPQNDNFVKNAGNRYQVCQITANMIASYANFEGFLRDLYKHEHFLEISKIEILPYQKNKRVLLISLRIKLYAQRDPSSVVDTPAPAAQAEAQPQDANKSSAAPDAKDQTQDEF